MNNLVEVAFFSDRVDEVADFYQVALAAEPVYRGRGIAIFQSGPVKILIHTRHPQDPAGPPNEDHVALGVADLANACDALAGQGWKLVHEPRTYDWGRSAYLRDPDGRLVELHAADQGGDGRH